MPIPQYVSLITGVSLSLSLYGILLNQAVVYHRSQAQDGFWTKFIVYFVVVLETAMVFFDVSEVYLFARIYGSAIVLMFRYNTVLMVLVSTIVQLFMSRRIFIVSTHRIGPGIIAVRSMCSLALGLYITVSGTPRLELGENILLGFPVPKSSFGIVLSWLLVCASVDIALSIYLTSYLLRRKLGFRSSDVLVTNIIRLAVEAGIITSVCAILDAILHVLPNDMVLLIIPDLMLSKLYANSLLASLNARPKWAEAAVADTFQAWCPPDNCEISAERKPQCHP